MRQLFILLAFLAVQLTQGQETIKVDLKNEFRAPDDIFAPLALYKLQDGGSITFSRPGSSKTYDIKLPDDLKGDLAFTTEFFTGWENEAVDRTVLIIVANYKSNRPELLIDYNGNLDLTDDGPAVQLDTDSKPQFDMQLQNTSNKDATYTVRLSTEFLNLPRHNSFDDKWVPMMTENPMHGDAELVEMQYWFGSKRQNMISTSLEVNGHRVQLGVMDWDCNGLYNDADDRLITGGYDSSYLSFSERDGAVAFGKEPLYEIGDQTYEVLHIDPAGRFLEIVKTDKQKKRILKVGDIVADLDFKLINGEKTSIHQYLEKGKYTLIDVWGTWCKPCVSKLPEVKAFYEKYKLQIKMVGIAHDNLSSVQRFVEKRNVTWPNGIFTKAIIDELKVEGYPYFVLLDDQGKVIMLGARDVAEVAAQLKQMSDED